MLERIFRRALEPATLQAGMVAQFLRRRVPVHFGGMSDPFQPAELRHRVTESFLCTLARYRYPTILSTRSKLVASDRYIAWLKEIGHIVVQFSFCSSRDSSAATFEPYSASPSELLRAMSILAKNGFWVTCRWQPYIPGVSEPAEEFVSRVSSVGCRHVALEHLKIPVERNNPLWGKLNMAAGRDLHDEYKANTATHDGLEYWSAPHAKFAPMPEAML